MTLRLGVVGYGTGGQHFHSPFVHAAEGVTLAGVVARAPATVAKVRADWPDVPVYASLTDLIAAGSCDAVTITTPPATRRALVLEAIAAGLHVVADKPFAPSAADARELAQAAEAKGVRLGVFQNRRWDADLRTLAAVIEAGRLGTLWRVHNRMDFDDPATLEQGPEGGLLRDLGSHLVDQMLWLLGPVAHVSAHLDHVDMPEGLTDAAFHITLRHKSGVFSVVSASKLNRMNTRELRAYGDKGAWLQHGTDVQAQAIFAGQRPWDDMAAWGHEPEHAWGTLHSEAGAERLPSQQGRYHDYYSAFAQAVASGGPLPVSAAEGAAVLDVLDAARLSHERGTSVAL